MWRAHRALGAAGRSGAVLAQPVPAADELDADLHDRLLAEGLALLAERGVTGKDVTPVLLEHFHAAQRRGEPARQPGPGRGQRPAGRRGRGRAVDRRGLTRAQPSITRWSRCSSCGRSPW